MTDTTEVAEAQPDPPLANPLFDDCLATLGQRVLGTARTQTDAWIRVAVDDWGRAGEMARTAGASYFSFLSGMDWQPNPNLDGEKFFTDEPEDLPPIITDERVRMAGGTSRFQVFARVHDPRRHVGLTLVADLDDAEPTVPSWVGVYAGADWHEREAWEMFGFSFTGHPGLRHLYLPDEFVGHPLRKDFPLTARLVRPWPGLVDMEEMPPAPTQADTQEPSDD